MVFKKFFLFSFLIFNLSYAKDLHTDSRLLLGGISTATGFGIGYLLNSQLPKVLEVADDLKYAHPNRYFATTQFLIGSVISLVTYKYLKTNYLFCNNLNKKIKAK